jgi:hypothetical protein
MAAKHEAPLDIPSVRHRLAQRQRVKREQMIATLVRKECPHLADKKYNLVITAFSRLYLKVADIQVFFDEHGLANDDGEVRASTKFLFQGLSLLLKYAVQLGITPMAAERIGLMKNAGVPYLDLATLRDGDNDEAEPAAESGSE